MIWAAIVNGEIDLHKQSWSESCSVDTARWAVDHPLWYFMTCGIFCAALKLLICLIAKCSMIVCWFHHHLELLSCIYHKLPASNLLWWYKISKHRLAQQNYAVIGVFVHKHWHIHASVRTERHFHATITLPEYAQFTASHKPVCWMANVILICQFMFYSYSILVSNK